ncbi:MAG: sigma-54-dependent Fis family transcriptional regulator [Leptolyngbya sp. PLA3]|nr:MAG: sigma-54-dependent Fis family transcriptional regulator [Cyanobacteria bacterium CYA]MCE7967506.1 sigma-54-dependent Fis family transcriptional regulator [Leptolyngbya sp. PL-A3]
MPDADTQPARILVVDDSPATREVLERHLRAEGHEVRTAESVAAAILALTEASADLVVTDMRMPGADGMDLVRHIREHHRGTGIIMVTGFATVGGAVSAMRQGVDDYLPKPFSDEELRCAVRTALDKVRLRRDLEAPGEAEAPDGLIGRSPAMQRVYRLIARAASASVPVLITGESGTGKELVARAIHYRGPRAAAPFLAVNCAAIPETLIESELFGHARGAFTGATAARQGFFIAADGGTLFLDEVAELSPIAQAKLLRVLQEQTVQAVGADQARRVDVRVIAATNKDLEGLAREGQFREDLFFRLHVLPIEVPPLREREGDVVLLLGHFLAAAAQRESVIAPRPTQAAIAALRRYPWPGNVRELQNLAQRLVIFAEAGEIDTVDLPTVMRYAAAAAPPAGGSTAAGGPGAAPAGAFGAASPPHRTLREVELAYIRAVLESVGGNKTRAAAILGIDRKSLREKLKSEGRSGEEGA